MTASQIGVLAVIGVAAVVVLLAVAWAGTAVEPGLDGWLRSLVLRCLRLVAFGAVFVAGWIASVLRGRTHREAKSTGPPVVSARKGWPARMVQVVRTALVVLCGFGLLRWGQPIDWAVLVAAAAGWVGCDPSVWLARRSVRWLVRLAGLASRDESTSSG
ncbi:MAG TPA: hypothetical protein VFX16_36305 [Pseudonocardiaceae bacterium]|nr:hypothetical protein [Pseudonocardiaceae bacterium]